MLIKVEKKDTKQKKNYSIINIQYKMADEKNKILTNKLKNSIRHE